ncbi:hypothetical protein HanPSC8_Chr17g0787881 [Helianthus annuus]|nr:hypothetical protein HanPSC8_Chr17g0787881 [Helianthus annuus]
MHQINPYQDYEAFQHYKNRTSTIDFTHTRTCFGHLTRNHNSPENPEVAGMPSTLSETNRSLRRNSFLFIRSPEIELRRDTILLISFEPLESPEKSPEFGDVAGALRRNSASSFG